MRRFRKAVAVMVLLLLAAFPCRSLADDGPSDLAVLLQEAFSKPDSPGNNLGFEGITFFHGLVISKKSNEVWVYYKGGTWTRMLSNVWFQGVPGSSFTIFEDECPPMGIKRGDLLSFFGFSWEGSFQEVDLSEITGEIPVYQIYGGWPIARAEAVFGVASMGCTVAMLTSPEVYPPSSNLVANLILLEPDPSQPGWFPLAGGEEEKWLGVTPAVPFRNGVDGFLDNYVDTGETVVGIELTRNERGALGLIVATLEAVHLLEFEPSGTVHTLIPVSGLP